MASEVGVLDIDPSKVVRKGRLQPGRMFLVDTAQGRIVADDEIKDELAAEHPYQRVARRGSHPRSTICPRATRHVARQGRLSRQQIVRLHHEELDMLVCADGADRRRSHRLDGNRHADRRAVDPSAHALRLLPAAVRPGHQSAARRHPRGDRHRLGRTLGPEGEPARPGPDACQQIVLPTPILTTTT